MDELEQSVSGRAPHESPPRLAEFDTLEQKAIETLVDSVKYLTTTSGIALSVYSQLLQRFTTSGLRTESLPKLIVLLPLILWLATIVSGVLAIYPRRYQAKTDLEKERVVVTIRKRKHFWAALTASLFLIAFLLLVYVVAAQLLNQYPFIGNP